MEIRIRNNSQLKKAIKEKPEKVVSALEVGLRNGLREFEGYFQKSQLSGRKSNNRGLKRQSGTAAMSLFVNVRKEGVDVLGKLSIGRSAWYLKVHQHYKFNGYIRPRNAMYLTIPVIRAAQNRRARDFSGLFLMKIPGRDPVLARKKGRAGIEVVFALKKQVYVPKRLYFFEDMRTKGFRTIKKHIKREIDNIK